MVKRTDVKWDKHVLEETHVENVVDIYYLHEPDTICRSVKFINTSGILAVTGDYGNWIFCREFHPSGDKNSYVSDTYWLEKLRIASKQEPGVFDWEEVRKSIKELLDDHEFSKEELKWLNELSNCDGTEYEYIAKCMDRPLSFESEMIPSGKRIDWWLEVIFDAFDEICDRKKVK